MKLNAFIVLFLCSLCVTSLKAESINIPVFEMKNDLAPLDVSGKWLFTNIDSEDNKSDQIYNTSIWTKIETPGTWPKLNNKNQYNVGWYKAQVKFPESAQNKEMIFLLDSYISGVDIYVDGNKVFSRGDGESSSSFYAIQPIPIKFKVTKPIHTISIRVNTLLMRGVYQNPFEIRQSKPYDFRMFFTYLYTDHLKTFAGFLLLIFGVFFALLYKKTKIKIYLMASLLGIGTFPYFGFTHEVFFKAFNYNSILLFHYLGILAMALFSNYFCQYLYKPNKKMLILFSIVQGLLAALFISQIFVFNFSLFLIIRKICFISSFIIAVHSFYVFYKFRKNQDIYQVNTEYIFYGYLLYMGFAFHDILQALGLFNSIGLLFFGNFIIASTIIWYSIEHFTHIFFTNKKLVHHLQELTNTLEQRVDERTNELKNSQSKLIEMAHRAGMAEVATSVLHNIGNASNTIITNTSRIIELIKSSHLKDLKKLNLLLFEKYEEDFKQAIHSQPKLASVGEAYNLVTQDLEQDQNQLIDYCQELDENINKIKSIISYQNKYVGHNFKESVALNNLLRVILDSHTELINKYNIQLNFDCGNDLSIEIEKNKLFHALYNIINNAIGSLIDKNTDALKLNVTAKNQTDKIVISVEDNGIGIEQGNLTNIFNQGFTTKKNGTGLGLHVSYNSIQELGGTLEVKSPGIDLGAKFIITVPKL